MAWSDEPRCSENSTWQDDGGRYGCLAALTIICLMAWILVAACVESAKVMIP